MSMRMQSAGLAAVALSAAATAERSAPVERSQEVKSIKTSIGEINLNSGNDLRRCLEQVENGQHLIEVASAESDLLAKILANGDPSNEWTAHVERMNRGAALLKEFGPVVRQFTDTARFHSDDLLDENGRPLMVTRQTMDTFLLKPSAKTRTRVRRFFRTVSKKG